MLRIIYGFKVEIKKGDTGDKVFSPLHDEAVDVSGPVDYLSLNEMFLSFATSPSVKAETGLEVFVIDNQTCVVGVKYGEMDFIRLHEFEYFNIPATCISPETEKISSRYGASPTVWIYSIDD